MPKGIGYGQVGAMKTVKPRMPKAKGVRRRRPGISVGKRVSPKRRMRRY